MRRTQWRQLDFQFQRSGRPPQALTSDSPAQLEAHRRRIVGYLTVKMPDPVDVVFTNNRSTMISFRHRQGRFSLRLHRLFRHADEIVLDHLSRYIVSPEKSDSQELDRFIVSHQDEIDRTHSTRKEKLKSKGRTHDLEEVLTQVCETYFKGSIDVHIGWGDPPRQRVRSRQRKRTISRALATYNYDTRTIRVSPVLDAPNVPTYVVQWVVYHELLHHVLPVKETGGRHRYHTRQFRILERAFTHYEEAKKWEESHLEQLLL